MKHPNAFAVFLSGQVATGLVALAPRVHIDVTAAQALEGATWALAAVVFIGHRLYTEGLKGLALTIWNGAKKVAVGQATPERSK